MKAQLSIIDGYAQEENLFTVDPFGAQYDFHILSPV